MWLYNLLIQINSYFDQFIKKFMCKSMNGNYEALEGDEIVEYTFIRSQIMDRSIYHPPPNADPNAPPPPSFAAIGANVSVPGVAAPTKGVESC